MSEDYTKKIYLPDPITVESPPLKGDYDYEELSVCRLRIKSDSFLDWGYDVALDLSLDQARKLVDGLNKFISISGNKE